MSFIVNENDIPKTKETKNEQIKSQKEVKSDDNEKHQEIQTQIGKGASSISYKVIDTRDSHVMCKKILKTEDTTSNFTESLIKESKVLHQIDQPCICKLIQKKKNFMKQSFQNPKKKIKASQKFHFSLKKKKKLIEDDILANTVKTKNSLEFAFVISDLNKLGMIHRVLRIDSIMLNSGFRTKIINFGLVHHGIE